jgi:L-iditol 2-dehydrogenase
LALQVAKSKGAEVIISGAAGDEERLDLAERLGADHCVHIEKQDLHALISERTRGMGVDVAFECSGSSGGIKDCLQGVRKGAEIVQVGLLGRPIELDYDEVAFKETQIKGSFAHNGGTWEKVIDLMKEQKIELRSLVTGEFPLDQWQEPFGLFENGVGLKYLLRPID